jgi:hypothetical protein
VPPIGLPDAAGLSMRRAAKPRFLHPNRKSPVSRRSPDQALRLSALQPTERAAHR